MKHWKMILASIAAIAAVVLVILSTAGCTISGRNDGEVYLEFGTKIAFGHTTKATTDQTDSVTLESQPFEDWIESKTNKDDDIDPVPVEEPTDVGG